MFWRRRRRLDEEIDSHIAEETADNISRGMDPFAARDAALRTFGNVSAVREKARELDPLYWLDTLCQDTRFACRLIARNPWMSVTIVATLTVGIALNVSVFSVLNGLLLRPWVHTQPETFLSIIPQYSGEYQLQYSDGGMSQPDYALFRNSLRSVESLGAYTSLSLSLSGAEAGTVRSALITCNLFDVLKLGPPVAGRYLTSAECGTPREPAVAILGERFWRTRYNSDRSIVGRIIHLNRVPFAVIGIAPSFTLPGANAERDVWVPYTMLGSVRPEKEYFSFAEPRAHWLSVIGRRRPEYSLQQVQEEVNLLARRADEAVPGRVSSPLITDGSIAQSPHMRGKTPLIFAVTLGTATLLLVLACVNVTTLLLSRSAARQREVAIRLSLGAARFRLLRQLLTESLALSGIAAAMSLVIAQYAPAALWNTLSLGPAAFDLKPDVTVLLYCLVVGVSTGLIAGLSPALESLRPRVAESLKGSSASVTPGRRRSRLRSALVAVQVALSVLILVEAGLFVRAQRQFVSYDPGFETERVVSITLASVLSGFSPPLSFYQELESRVAAMPGVVSASYASLAPWSGRNSTRFSEIDGKPLPRARDFRLDPARRLIATEYFQVLGIPILRGRAFERGERSDVVPAVISEAMARRYWPGQDPIGRQFRTMTLHQVVGVCKDVQSVKYMQDDGPFYYAPLDAMKSRPPVMVVRVAGDTAVAVTALRSVVRQADPQMATTIVTLASMIDAQAESLKPLLIHGAFGASLALLLALTGVYGVVSFSVSQRIPEIGIRMALGADRQNVMALVMRSGAGPVCAGLLVGVALALGAATAVESLLFGFNARDPLTITFVPLLLLLAALGAIWVPARRASRLDPLVSLRYE